MDVKTGNLLTPEALFVKNYISKLTKIAEKKFFKLKGLKPGTSLNDEGYSFKNNRFHLTDNFAVLNEGILFYYNTYEIGPYALGTTEVLIPYGELKGILVKAYK